MSVWKWIGSAIINGIVSASLYADPLCDETASSCTRCVSLRGNSGTLFRWSASPGTTGGPDLTAPLVTDRPDFTEASSTVGVGVAQLEFGYTFIEDDDGLTETRFHSWGEPLLRVGVWRDWLELRIGVAPVSESETTAGREQRASGMEDMYLGAKIGLTPQAGFRPEMALIPQMFVPVGSSSFTADEILPGLNWLYSWDLTDQLVLAGSTQFNRGRSPSNESYTLWAQSASLGFSLTDRWGAYTEWFALIPHSAADIDHEHYVNGGFTLGISDDLQWDIRVGAGINDEAADFFCGTGFAWRFR
jgi:hypothetical protein